MHVQYMNGLLLTSNLTLWKHFYVTSTTKSIDTNLMTPNLLFVVDKNTILSNLWKSKTYRMLLISCLWWFNRIRRNFCTPTYLEFSRNSVGKLTKAIVYEGREEKPSEINCKTLVKYDAFEINHQKVLYIKWEWPKNVL